ncbi:MAG TPA: hypothetical protein VFA11_14935 [Acidimicrobiales bacterium]|nr:hypothetical protein [Acidimicrobiales bacterium]
MGPVRFQRRPVGNHWSFVTAVPDDLTGSERRMAEVFDDGGLP